MDGLARHPYRGQRYAGLVAEPTLITALGLPAYCLALTLAGSSRYLLLRWLLIAGLHQVDAVPAGLPSCQGTLLWRPYGLF
ncbi:MAG: hypothetical protein IKZ92_05650 [Muribaculaceae bacterium]|nr:hypothetical protein [Muribaculaceae bacterium]